MPFDIVVDQDSGALVNLHQCASETIAAIGMILAAKQGFSLAQFNLGAMFDTGQGVAQDYKEAVRWYRLVAQQEDADAQQNLGIMFEEGRGVDADIVRAHMWFNIAAVGGNKDNAIRRDTVARKMDPKRVEEAQRMARECMASKFKKFDSTNKMEQ